MAFIIDDNRLKRAGLDYWHMLDISYYKNIAEFFTAMSDLALDEGVLNIDNAFPDTSAYELYYFTTKAPNVYTDPVYKDNVYLIFGSETKGLDEALLYKNPNQCVRIPMQSEARSMNLANSVAIGAFEVLRQWGFPKLQNHGKMSD